MWVRASPAAYAAAPSTAWRRCSGLRQGIHLPASPVRPPGQEGLQRAQVSGRQAKGNRRVGECGNRRGKRVGQICSRAPTAALFKQIYPILQPDGRLDAVDARHGTEALVEAHERLEFVTHPRCLPDGPCGANQSAQRALGGPTLDPVQCSACSKSGEKEDKRCSHQRHSSGGGVATLATASIKLVKVMSLGDANLTSRPVAPAVCRIVAVAITPSARI
eukprot:3210336-Prymnesium_polylepis.1